MPKKLKHSVYVCIIIIIKIIIIIFIINMKEIIIECIKLLSMQTDVHKAIYTQN